jgi:hypothetical protein
VKLLKRTAIALTFILTLLTSVFAGTLLNQNGPRAFIVQAETSNDNTVTYGNTNANVTIQSPENKTYNENNVTLTFTIESDVPPVENFSGDVCDLYLEHGCVLDYDTSKLVNDVSKTYWIFPNDVPITLSGSGNRYVGNTTLTGLTQGPHNVTVWIRADQYMISYAILNGLFFQRFPLASHHK